MNNAAPEPRLPTAMRLPRRATLVAALLMFVGTFALFARTITFDQISLDDQMFVFRNPQVLEGLSWNNVVWAMTDVSTSGWYPMHLISYMLDVSLHLGAEIDPGRFHFTNTLLHAVNATLLFVALRMLTGSLWASLAVAALFAAHPLRVESVAWIAERKGLLAGLFWMLGMIAYAHYARRPSVGRYLLLMACLALGLMSKALLVTLPFVLLLMDYWPMRRWRTVRDDDTGDASDAGDTGDAGDTHDDAPRFAPASARRLIVEKLPLLALCVADAAIMIYASIAMKTIGADSPHPLDLRIAEALESYVLYLRDTVWPSDLMLGHLLPDEYNLTTALAAAALLVVLTAAIGVAVWRAPRRRGYLAVGWLWFLGVMAPTAGVVLQIADFTRADRYTYIPSIGLFVIVVWGVRAVVADRPTARRAAVIACVAVVVALSVVTFMQLRHWRHSGTLGEHVLSIDPDNRYAHNLAGGHYAREGDFARAERHYRALAEVIDPTYTAAAKNCFNIAQMVEKQGRMDEALHWYAEANRLSGGSGLFLAQTNLGVRALEAGDLDEAERRFRAALEDKPDHDKAWFNLGHVALRRGDLAGAAERFARAAELDPDWADAWYNLGLAYGRMNRLDNALPALRRAVEFGPDIAEHHRALGKALMGLKRFTDATDALTRAVNLDDSHAETRNLLGQALANTDDIRSALPHFEAATRLDPDNAKYWDNLGLARNAAGQTDAAIDAFERALRADPTYAPAQRRLDALRRTPGTTSPR